jgi:predicted transcriptional regulator YdeE
MEIQVVRKDGFSAVGIRWEGTFAAAAAGEIRQIQAEMQKRVDEIQHLVNPDMLLCASYVNRPDGFTAYLCAEVSEIPKIPEGMVSITIPAQTYARCELQKGDSVQQSYQKLYEWMEEQGYQPNKDGLTHLEEYPVSNDPYDTDPAFVILAPLQNK